MTDKPCPFCGTPEPLLDEVDKGIWAIVCDSCGVQGPIIGTLGVLHGDQSPEKAAELWNKRPQHDPQPAALARRDRAVPEQLGDEPVAQARPRPGLPRARAVLPSARRQGRAPRQPLPRRGG